MVLEWADEGEGVDLEGLRRKVGVESAWGRGGEVGGRKRKLKMVEDADDLDGMEEE